METDTLKTCRICKLAKPINEFYRHRNTSDLLRSECKVCWNKSSLDYYFSNKEEMVEKRKDYHFRSKYGLTKEEVQRMKEAQDYKCVICKEKKPLVVDHNHETGKVRGLLCNTCNLGVGYIRDNPGWAEKAARYLEAYRG